MTVRSVNRHHKSKLHKWLGPNGGTHWAIAGSVAVIMLGGYLIYSGIDNNRTTTTSIFAIERTPAPVAPTSPHR